MTDHDKDPSKLTPDEAADAVQDIVKQSQEVSKSFHHTVADLGRHVDYLKFKSRIRSDRI